MDKRRGHFRSVNGVKKTGTRRSQNQLFAQKHEEFQSILDFRPGENSVGKVLERIRRESRDEVEKGHWFENLVARVLKDNPQYEISEVYRWKEWPEREELTGLDGRDIGIDLVAKRNYGGWIAIQCKCYAENRTVGKKDIDSFIAASQRDPFDLRFIIATCKWSQTAEAEIERLSLPMRRIDFLEHIADPISEEVAERPVRQLWPLQQQAVDDVVAGLRNHDRGRLTMACGTGKTFVSLRIAERSVDNGGRILFLVPSIALISQTRREWLLHTTRKLKSLVVCSDSSAGGRGENQQAFRVSELECAVTSKPSDIADTLRNEESATRVIFCTYQSLLHVSIAQSEHNAPAFELAIMDEAHRTTGVDKKASGIAKESLFQTIHNDNDILASKRLYMTATPRIYKESSRRSLKKRNIETVDMSDFDVYGPEFHRLSFKKAVNAGLLSDYRVIVLGVREDAATSHMRQTLVELGEKQSSGRGKLMFVTGKDITRLLGTSLAINGMTEGKDSDKPIRLHRIITFANTIARSKFFAAGMSHPQVLNITTRRIRSTRTDADAAMKVEAEHLDASNSALDRNKALRKLKSADKDGVARILCNVKLFGEGVDVPSLDAIAFMEPRDSQIDVIQSVGRVMRRSEGKRYGYIVVPISIDPGKDIADALAEGTDGYSTLGKVLRALQSHDERLAEDPLQFVEVHENVKPDVGDVQGQTELVLKLSDVSNSIYAHVIAASGLGNPGYQASLDIEYVVRRAARKFMEGQFEREIANVLGLAVEGGAKNLCTIAALLVANACLLHRRLCDLPDLQFLPALNKIGGSSNPRNILREAWKAVLVRDYRPVFEPALAVLDVLPDWKSMGESLQMLAEWANQIADSLSELGYDHAGPLYHRILPSAKADGAFYTNNISALMLAQLALDDGFVDWSDSEKIRRLRVIDPACGTGTLLMAVMHTIKSRFDGPKSLDDDAKKDFHRMLVENVICGLDINRHAIQLAACNLTLGAPTVDYKQMNLFTLKHGPQPDGSVRSGSLDIIETTNQSDSILSLVRPLQTMSGVQAEQVDKATEPEFPLKELDLVIMNPPFTNNTLRNRQYGNTAVKRLQNHEKELRNELITQDPNCANVVNSNSIRTFFTPIAERLLHQENGTLAKVLPATACTGASGEGERKFLAKHFHISIIVTSHDPKRINFSENTSIHECLLVARRKFEGDEQPTLFVSLSKMPLTPNDSYAASGAIASEAGGGRATFEWGNIIRWPSNLIEAGNWTPVQWFSEELVKAVYKVENSALLEPTGLRHEIGPAGRRISDAFEKSSKNQVGAVHVFWSIKSTIRQTMRGVPDEWFCAKSNKVNLANKYWHRRSHVLIAVRYDTINSRLSALWSAKASVGTGWVPVAVDNEHHAKALVAWWNSTPARLMLMNRRDRKLTYPKWSLKQLRTVGVPKPHNPAWKLLADAWEEVRDVEMLPLRDAENCLARNVIDRAAAKALGVEESRIANWRRLLSLEPTITNKPAQMN